MRNLIIPAAGKSSRFPNMKPKWLLTHPDGQLMIEKVLSSMDLKEYDNIIITVLRSHCKKYEADVILKQIFGNKVKTCILDESTNSSVETVIETIKKHKLQGYVTIKDSDCYVKATLPRDGQFICGLELNPDSSVQNVQNKSFILKNDNNMVIEIIEKNIISNIICVGVYCISVENLTFAYDKISKSVAYRFNNEMYFSHIISYLLSRGEMIHYIPAEQFIDWGTMQDWRVEQEKYKTYFFDIDGVILKNVGKRGRKNWYNSNEVIPENLDILKKLSSEGNQIIFTTSRDDRGIEMFVNLMKENNIKYKTIITNCYHSQRIIINDFAQTNPYPSCKSLSISRNSLLREYIK